MSLLYGGSALLRFIACIGSPWRPAVSYVQFFQYIYLAICFNIIYVSVNLVNEKWLHVDTFMTLWHSGPVQHVSADATEWY